MASLTFLKTPPSKLASIAIALATGLVAAETTYYLVDLYSESDAVVQVTSGDSMQSSIEQIKAFPLFSAAKAKPNLSVVPSTKLNMSLLGTAWHHNASQSSALIKVQSNKPKVYRVSDSLGSGIKVKAIEQDKVLIESRGSLETLAFPKQDRQLIKGGQAKTAKAPAARSGNAQSTAIAMAAEVLSGIPLDLATITAAAQAGSGVQLDPSQIAELADQAPLLMDRLNINASGLYQPKNSSHVGRLIGLKDGDRIMSVNGRSFSDIVSNPVALAAAAATGKLKLSVRRGGEDIVITTALP